MTSSAIAIAWSTWCRHRRGLVASLAILLGLVILYPILFSYTNSYAVLIVSTIPVGVVCAYVLNATLFVDESGSMSSSYPRHMLTLPVQSGALAFWPMLIASLAAALLWIVIAVLIYGLSGFATPVLVPALGMAALVAWCQALSWLPIKNPWLRVPATLAPILALMAAPLFLNPFGAPSSPWLVALLAAYVAGAYTVGLVAIVNDRRGNVWRLWPANFRPQSAASRSWANSSRRPFRSPGAAQLWYEWNCHGLVLPVFVGGLMVTFLALKFWSGPRINSYQVPMTLLLFLGMPVVIAGATGSIFGQLRPVWVDNRGFTTFLAIRPISGSSLVAAKFRMALTSAVLSWAIAIAGTLFWVVAAYDTAYFVELGRDFLARYPGGRGVAILVLAGALGPAVIWQFLTNWVAPSFYGRRWVVQAGGWVFCAVLMILAAALVRFMIPPNDWSGLVPLLPWLAASALLLKMGIAIGAFTVALRRRLLTFQAAGNIVGIWLGLTCGWLALAALVLTSESTRFGWPTLVLGIAAFPPLARFPLATIAFDLNRHR